MQDNQIKGECQLRDHVKSIEFYNKKSDKLGRDTKRQSKNWKKRQKKVDKQK